MGADDVWQRWEPWAIPGQELATGVLRGAVRRGEVAHAWAFVGPAGVGQEQAARALAAALLCPNSDPEAGPGAEPGSDPVGAACGACDVCARCRRGAHPAYWEFAPVGAFHRVADVREQWVRTAFRTGAEGSWKVLRILDADRMNEAAANAFLKALEEPPPSTVWILDVADPDELPDTILSRCRSVRFRPWGARELEEEAAALGLSEPVDRRLAVRASSGSPVRLRRLAASGGLDDLRAHRDIAGALRRRGAGEALVAARRLDEEAKRHSAELKAAGRSELAELAALYGEQVPRAVGKAVEERLGREEREARVHAVQSALDDLVAWYRDCLLVAAGGHPGEAVHADAAEQLVQDAATLSPGAVLRAIDLILAAREDLELNVQQGLTLEALFIQVAALSRA